MLPALLPVLVVDFCYGWLLWVYLTWLPTLFKNEFGLDARRRSPSTPAWCCSPASSATSPAAGCPTSCCAARAGRWPAGCRSSSGCRLAGLPAAGAVLALAGTATVSLAAAFFFLELTNSTIWALPMDIAPGHAGAASGLVNTGFGIAGVLSPSVFGLLLDPPAATGGCRCCCR